MANFLSLPLEIRQRIIFLALKDAAFQDIRFSKFQYCLNWNLCKINDCLQIKDYRDTIGTVCTPNVHDTAIKLASVDPQLRYDLMYPLGLILPNFENLKELDFDGDNALDFLAQSLMTRSCLGRRFNMVYVSDSYYDAGKNGVWCQNMTAEKRNSWFARICSAKRPRSMVSPLE